MDSNYVEIELTNKDDIIHLEVLSDEHFGDPKRDTELCEKRQNAILDDPNRYTAFGGDMFNNIMPWDKRWSLEASKHNSLTKEVQEWEGFHKPLFDIHKEYMEKCKWPKIWYGIAGNHEYQDRSVDHYWMKQLFDKQEIKYLGTRGWIGLQVNWKGTPLHRWKLFVAHGFGSSQALEKPLQDMKINNYADVFLMGHLHRKFVAPELVYDFNFSEKRYIEREIYLANTGTFTNSIIRGQDSWFEHRNRSIHSKPGTITISFDGYNKKLIGHL